MVWVQGELEALMLRVFRKADVDHSGHLSRREFKEALRVRVREGGRKRGQDEGGGGEWPRSVGCGASMVRSASVHCVCAMKVCIPAYRHLLMGV